MSQITESSAAAMDIAVEILTKLLGKEVKPLRWLRNITYAFLIEQESGIFTLKFWKDNDPNGLILVVLDLVKTSGNWKPIKAAVVKPDTHYDLVFDSISGEMSEIKKE